MILKQKYYLIDTENVGNRWFDLPEKMGKKDRIVTFYTKHHSKHLEEYLMKQVHNPKILWLECVVGNNALDYQLIGVLSYLIARHPQASFFIYSNDKDYQSTVDFWKSRGITICQKGFEITNRKKAKKKNGKNKKTTEVQGMEVKIQNPDKVIPTVSSKQEELRQGKLTEEQYVIEIAKSVPTSDLGGWYQALTAILGQEKGRNWYLKVRDDAELRVTLSKYCTRDEYFCGVNLVTIVLNLHGLDVIRAEEGYKIIQPHN